MFICLAATLSACSPSASNVAASQTPGAATTGNVQEPSLKGQPDVVAVYRMNGPDGAQAGTMIVEANDSGAARVEVRPASGNAPPQVG
jgi:hypothetical protein